MKAIRQVLALLFCFGFHYFFAQDSISSVPKRVYMTKAIENLNPIIIDGKLDDHAWNTVEWGNDFVEWQPDENTPPSEQTKFKILYDAKYLYIGVRAYDKSPDSIVKRLGRRDTFDGDWVEVNIDSYHDLRTAFSFTGSVSGVKGDEFISNNGNNWDSSWNPIWTMKSNIDEEGWISEFKNPLSQLRFNNDKLQFVENIETEGETRYVNATIDQSTLSASFRLNYTINPDLTIQYYAQPFISRGRYSDFKYVTNPIADSFNDRFELYNDDQISFDSNAGLYSVDEDSNGVTDYQIGNPNFSFVQFRSNLVVRWEYIPGSELFLVWSQGVTGLVDPMIDLFDGLEKGIADQQLENIFLIKATYRFVL